MNDRALHHRLGGVAGVLFVVLFVASGFVGTSELSGVDQTGDAIARDLVENRHDGLQVSVFLLLLATISGFWFLASLHSQLPADKRSPEVWVAVFGGIGLVINVMVLGVVLSAMFAVDSLTNDPETAKTLWLLEQGAWIPMSATLATFILGTSASAIRHGNPPRWLGWAGLLVTAVLILNTWFGMGSPIVLGFVWVLALAIIVTVRLPTSGSPPERSVDPPV